ncbi:hypothetical protein CYMTET_28497 [Cymbomonas tetramitiformis]|uniref:Reverse transcriptase domain-containing protein n=1 Tax=Cymbomonas tetramitiformis TaxID=36881 RepID=A0AAE0FMS9_9CHLO|nr:hypothetical protein CYMTET_28497 [Cymbomonas tetramitiformis]
MPDSYERELVQHWPPRERAVPVLDEEEDVEFIERTSRYGSSTRDTMEMVGDACDTDQVSPGVTGDLDPVSSSPLSPLNGRDCEQTLTGFQERGPLPDWNFPHVYSAEGEFLNPCEVLGESVWSKPEFNMRSEVFGELLSSWQDRWSGIDLSAHGVSLAALNEFKSATEAIGAAVPVVTERAHRWAMVFQDDPCVDALVRSVSVGAGWKFDLDAVCMTGKNYVREGFEHKVDALHSEELKHRRVVPILESCAGATHGVGVVDKDHSNFEKVRVVHNYSEGDDMSVNSATEIPEQKWRSVTDALAFLRPKYFMIKVDVKSVYRHLPIALQYLKFHTYRWNGVVADLRFPFGHRAVPGKFHEVTTALVRFMRGHGFSATVGFLDDFWCVCETEAQAQQALLLLQDVLEFLGLDVAWDKCATPGQDEVFLGVRLCTNGDGEGTVSASMPPAKCERLRQTALKLATEGWCARKDLERFMGQLAFASRLVRGLSLLRVKDKWLKISGGAKFDFRFVADCLALYNGQQVVLSRRVVKPSHFSVDASTGTGMGGFLDGKYFVVSWLDLMAMPQEVFYPFRDRASSQINYLELFSVFWALSLWGEDLRGLTVVLITNNTPTKGMLEKWRCTPDFRKLLRRIFQQCVAFDVRLIVEWVPSKVNQFADALSRKEMSLFFELHREWKTSCIWRKDRHDWMLFAEVFARLDKRFGPFSVDACCDAFGANKQTLNVGTSACFVIPVWPSADFYKFIVARPGVFFPVERFEAETDLFSAFDCFGSNRQFYGPTRSRNEGFGGRHGPLHCECGGLQHPLLLRDGRKANITAKKQNCFSKSSVMTKGSVKFTGKEQMEVATSFSKTKQFSERQHKVLFQTLMSTMK